MHPPLVDVVTINRVDLVSPSRSNFEWSATCEEGDFAAQPAADGRSCTPVVAVTRRWPATELVKEITVHSEAALRAMSEACQPQASLLAKQKEMLQSRLDYTGQVTPNPTPEDEITQGWPFWGGASCDACIASERERLQIPGAVPASTAGAAGTLPLTESTSTCWLLPHTVCCGVCLQGKLPPCPVDPIIAPNLEIMLKGKPELQRLALVK